MSKVKRRNGFLVSLIIPVIFVVLWWVIALRVDNPIVLPYVSQVFALLINPMGELISMGSLLSNVIVSLIRVLVGYILAVLLAIPMGILMGYYSSIHDLLTTFWAFFALFLPWPGFHWFWHGLE